MQAQLVLVPVPVPVRLAAPRQPAEALPSFRMQSTRQRRPATQAIRAYSFHGSFGEGHGQKILDLHPRVKLFQGAIRGIGLQAQCRSRKARFRMAKAFVNALAHRAPALGTVAADASPMIDVDTVKKP